MSFYFWMDILSLITLLFDIHWITNSMYSNDSNPTKETIVFNILKTIRIARLVYIMKFVKNSYQDKYYTMYDYFVNKLKIKEDDANALLGRKKKNLKTTKQLRGAKSYGSETQFGFEANLKQKFVDDAVQANKRGNILADDDDLRQGDIELAVSESKTNRAFESRLARRIIYLTNKRLMMMILIMLIFVPMFSVQFFTSLEQGFDKDVQYLSRVYHVQAFALDSYADVLNQEYRQFQSEILEIRLGTFSKTFGSDQYLRINEVLSKASAPVTVLDAAGAETSTSGSIKISIREFIRWQAILDLLRTLFVVILFYIAIYFFMSDATRLIIEPLESLLQQVKEMSQNPSKALKLAEKRKRASRRRKGKSQSDLDSIRETISKLAYLLVLGFGRAGDSVISKILYSKNMNLQIKASGEMVFGIFGFCDIRNFTDVTEVLGTEVIRFVNTCGDIVHKIVDKYKGGANKNIGDAFLLVWKLESRLSDVQEFTEFTLSPAEREAIWGQYTPLKNYEKEQQLIKHARAKSPAPNPEYQEVGDQPLRPAGVDANGINLGSEINRLARQKTFKETIKRWDLKKVELMTARFRNNLQNSTLAELSLISFLKCIEGVTTDPRTLRYSRHEDIRRKLGDYLVKLGFGLHAGWAVEGALGSKYKIDLSYLSPDVDMSSRLEGMTKKYKKPLLFTNAIFNLMTSSSIMRLCRKIDRVLVNRDKVMEYYAIDFSVDYLRHMDRITRLGARGKIDAKKLALCGIRRPGKTYRVSLAGKPGPKQQQQILEGNIDFEQFKDFDKIERTYEEILMDQNLCFLLGIDSPENRSERQDFMAAFADAFAHYEAGDWDASIAKFEAVAQQFTLDGAADGPSEFLLKYMRQARGTQEYDDFVQRDHSRVSPDE